VLSLIGKSIVGAPTIWLFALGLKPVLNPVTCEFLRTGLHQYKSVPFAIGLQGVSKEVCTTLWLFPRNMNRTVSPGCAVMDSGVKANCGVG
jgi:hypothetical protein